MGSICWDTDTVIMSSMNAVIFGTGEYVTGWTGAAGSKSDKSLGVVALVHFDLRERRLIGEKIALCGTNGGKFDNIRKHFDEKIKFKNLPNLSFDQFPQDKSVNPKAYLDALDKGLHVMATKPMVKTLKEHQYLVDKAKEKNVLLQIEVHKRFDPIYSDARMRIQKLGDFNFFTAYMSQPKFQLETFKAWAGLGSDISYYLNSHHIDLHVWAMQGKARCVAVRAIASTGVVAEKILGRPCEDTITVTAEWENIASKSIGHAVYTASWPAAKADVHSQQRFFCLMERGEVTAEQCHRGYTLDSDQSDGLMSLNPLYIRNVPDSSGRYCGQAGYGYVSFERFVRAAGEINAGKATAAEFDAELPTGRVTEAVTAILEAGRKSLDNGGAKVTLVYDDLNAANKDKIMELRL